MNLDIKTLRLKLLLQEELSDKQKKQVDKWTVSKRKNRNIDFSDNFFGGKDNMRRSFDLQTPEKISKHAKLIAKHFENHPHIRITDYGRGEASETVQTQMGPKERPISIAKALSKTGADHLVPGFANDPTRTSASKNLHKDYQVTITRHPHDIGGMTSKGQSWANESCMNYENGSNNQYLQDDVEHGTHVAYLHRKDDPEMKKPLARIALKPFNNIDDDKDTILRPEDRTYGSGGSHFNHTVHAILDQHLSGSPGSLYEKNQNVYDDSNQDAYFAATKKEHLQAGIEKLASIKSTTSKTRGVPDRLADAIIDHPKFNAKLAEHAIDQIEPDFDLNKDDRHEGKERLISSITQYSNPKRILNKISDRHFKKLINLPYMSNPFHIHNPRIKLLTAERGVTQHTDLLLKHLSNSDSYEYGTTIDKIAFHRDHNALQQNPDITQKIIDHYVANKPRFKNDGRTKDNQNMVHGSIMSALITSLPKEKVTKAHLDEFFNTPHNEVPRPQYTNKVIKHPGVENLLTAEHKKQIARSVKKHGSDWFD